MTPQERIDWRIANAAAIMNVSNEEAAKHLDSLLGPQWRAKFLSDEKGDEATEDASESGSSTLAKSP